MLFRRHGACAVKNFSNAELTVALDMPELVSTFREDWDCRDENRLVIKKIVLNRWFLSEQKFDLVFCRGAFFFLAPDVKIVPKIYDLLEKDGAAFWGGGYGRYTPDAVIEKIGDESRIKNNALGRRIYSVAQLETLLKLSDLADRSEIIEAGGLWVLMRK